MPIIISYLDRLFTAISLRPSFRAAALREVCAHAVLGAHAHIVRYYSAWAEENHMIIQNEFCNGRLQWIDCVCYTCMMVFNYRR